MNSVNVHELDAEVMVPIGGSPAPAAADGPDDFVKSIQNSDFLNLVGVISNFAGVLGIFSTVTGVISFLQGLSQPDNSAILDAITQLQKTLQSDFSQLGDLIKQQTQIIQDTVNRNAMAAALANSDTAADRIQAFLSSGDNEAFETAENQSIAGFKFFIELNLTSPADLFFFLPGFIKAGTIRLFVIASEPVSMREPQSVLIGDISSMVTLLTTMINSIKSTINAAHFVSTKSHTVQCPVFQPIREATAPDFGPPHRTVGVIDGYFHGENVVNSAPVIFAFFDAQQGNPPCEQPSGLEKGALASAEQARSQGVTDELAFIGVPYFEQILQSWTTLLTAVSTPPITTVIDLNGTWITGGAPGPVITVNGNSLSVDLSLYKRPSAYGSILDSSDITVTFPDDATYTAVLQPPSTIQWSNNTAWTKA